MLPRGAIVAAAALGSAGGESGRLKLDADEFLRSDRDFKHGCGSLPL